MSRVTIRTSIAPGFAERTGTTATTDVHSGSRSRRAVSSMRCRSQTSPGETTDSARIVDSRVVMWKLLKNSRNAPPSANTSSL
jgi:hypothetical protein